MKKLKKRIAKNIQELREHRLREHWGIIILTLGFISGMFILGSAIYSSITTGQNITLREFSIIHFLGYLFFILTSPEILFILAINQGQNPIIFTITAVITALLAQTIDYGIGRFMSRSFIFHIIKRKKYQRMKNKINKYSGWVVLFFNISPFSSPLILLTAGMIRYKYTSAMKYSFFGLLIKYIILALVFMII
jgi:membrane protein YqaA with SNARE-associated domain